MSKVDKALGHGWRFVSVFAWRKRLMRRGRFWLWGHYDGTVSRS